MSGRPATQRQICVGRGITVPVLEDVAEANVVVGGSGVPADVYIARTKDVVEYLEPQLSWEV